MILDPSVGSVNSIHFILRLVPSTQMAGTIFLSGAIMALIERLHPWGSLHRLYYLALLLPEQFVWLISSGGVIEALITGQFAIGIATSRFFIFASQCTTILLTIVYCMAIVEIYIPRIRWIGLRQ